MPMEVETMDPQACLRRLRDARLESDYEEAMHAAHDLIVWLASGGAVPTPTRAQLLLLLRATRVRMAQLADECRVDCRYGVPRVPS